MKKVIVFAFGLSLVLSACSALLKPAVLTSTPEVDLQATAAVAVQQTRGALPTGTIAPSDTPIIAAPSATHTQPPTATPTETPDTTILTPSATSDTPTVSATGILAITTPSITPTGTLHPQYYGTVPPKSPSGYITLLNRSKAEAYISLVCTSNHGEITILEYPVNKMIKIKAPAGNYVYVAWVGGRQMSGSFKLSESADRTIKIYKDKIMIGK